MGTACALAPPRGSGVLPTLLHGAEAAPAALCSLGPLPKHTLLSEQVRTEEAPPSPALPAASGNKIPSPVDSAAAWFR